MHPEATTYLMTHGREFAYQTTWIDEETPEAKQRLRREILGAALAVHAEDQRLRQTVLIHPSVS